MRRSHGLGVVPGQQLFDVRLFVPASNGCHDVGQIALGLDPVEFAGLDQGRDDRPVLCASIVTGEERIFSVKRNWTDRTLDCVGIHLDATVVEE